MPKPGSRYFATLLRAFGVRGSGDDLALPLASQVMPVVVVADETEPMPRYAWGGIIASGAGTFTVLELRCMVPTRVRSVGNFLAAGVANQASVVTSKASLITAAAATVSPSYNPTAIAPQNILRTGQAVASMSGFRLRGPTLFDLHEQFEPGTFVSIIAETNTVAGDFGILWEEIPS